MKVISPWRLVAVFTGFVACWAFSGGAAAGFFLLGTVVGSFTIEIKRTKSDAR